MTAFLGAALGLTLFASLPFWLPRAVVALRMRIFAAVNGSEGIAIPGPRIGVAQFREVYAHPAANGRSRGAALSDLFWYWLSPGPELHQEHLEPGERYRQVALATRRILALSRQATEALAERVTARVLASDAHEDRQWLRLRDLMMPIWAEFYYEVVFQECCPQRARQLIVANANDVVNALKCCRLRHMPRRERLTRYLVQRLERGHMPHELPPELTLEERALYLQGVFFNTAVVQSSEAMTHLLLLIAQHDDVQTRLRQAYDQDYLDRVITEALRMHPLFGIAHRIASADLAVDDQTTLQRGSVLCFNYPEFQQQGFDDPEAFAPDRWLQLSPRDANYIPFGVTANRPCPAQAVALISMRVVSRELVARFHLHSSASHTRSVPNRGPCLLISTAASPNPVLTRVLLQWMRVIDLWENVGRSLLQLVLGSYMVLDARRQRLCQRYFEQQDGV